MDLASIQNTYNAGSTQNAFQKKAREAADGFESFFMYQMLQTMDVGTPEELGGGFAEDMFRGIRNEHLADSLVKSGTGIGLSDQIYNEIMNQQEMK